MTTLHIPVGAPASGKSTLGNHLVSEGVVLPGCVISPDTLRANLLGDITEQSQNNLIFKAAFACMRAALAGGQDVYFDATNANQKSFERVLRNTTPHECDVKVHFFDLPLETLLTRNSARDRVVPEDVIKRMYRTQHLMTFDNINLPDNITGFQIIHYKE